jgi:hypothetical protein
MESTTEDQVQKRTSGGAVQNSYEWPVDKTFPPYENVSLALAVLNDSCHYQPVEFLSGSWRTQLALDGRHGGKERGNIELHERRWAI